MTATTPEQLSDEQLQTMIEDMIEARVASDRAFNLQRQGRAGTNAQVDGSEAVVVGAAHALDPAVDWVVPQYRELVGLQRFGPEVLEQYMLYLRGHPAGGHMADGVRVFPPQISLASQLPKAVGLAWGLRLQRRAGVVLAFFGDGSSSEGDFYEAANLAGVMAAPIVFVLVNNQWAISTPTHRQTAAASFADKAAAVGMPGTRIDGTDPVVVHGTVAAARARAAAGEGPTLIEAVTYRLAAHTTADDHHRYVPADELAAAHARDPLHLFEHRLTEAGLWDSGRGEAARSAADARIEAAVARAEATPLDPTHGFTHLFAEPTPRMRRQRDALARRREGGR